LHPTKPQGFSPNPPVSFAERFCSSGKLPLVMGITKRYARLLLGTGGGFWIQAGPLTMPFGF